jgi:hypothetical protein
MSVDNDFREECTPEAIRRRVRLKRASLNRVILTRSSDGRLCHGFTRRFNDTDRPARTNLLWCRVQSAAHQTCADKSDREGPCSLMCPILLYRSQMLTLGNCITSLPELWDSIRIGSPRTPPMVSLILEIAETMLIAIRITLAIVVRFNEFYARSPVIFVLKEGE